MQVRVQLISAFLSLSFMRSYIKGLNFCDLFTPVINGNCFFISAER